VNDEKNLVLTKFLDLFDIFLNFTLSSARFTFISSISFLSKKCLHTLLNSNFEKRKKKKKKKYKNGPY